MIRHTLPIYLFLLLFSLASCAPQSSSTESGGEISTEASDSLPRLTQLKLKPGEGLQVVATTTLVADVVGRVGGDAIEVRGLLPVGADPHGYQATPDDLRAVSDGHLLFVNGLGLEESLDSLLDEARAKTVPVNAGVETLAFGEEENGKEDEVGHAEDAEDTHHHAGSNPHTWWSIAAVIQWTRNIEGALSAVDPAHTEQYAANASTYRAELVALQSELEGLVAQIPADRRKLATDHDTLTYFAHDFDFRVIGLIVPAFSSLAEPSAKHLAELQDQIQAEGVEAIFVGSTVNPRQAEQLAQDLGIRVVPIFTDSLSAADGPAPNYLEFMRYNVGAIVDALTNP